MFLDGGLRMLKLNPRTGDKLAETILDDRDPESGKELWRFKTPSGIIGNVFTYEHKGKQYIVFASGAGSSTAAPLVTRGRVAMRANRIGSAATAPPMAGTAERQAQPKRQALVCDAAAHVEDERAARPGGLSAAQAHRLHQPLLAHDAADGVPVAGVAPFDEGRTGGVGSDVVLKTNGPEFVCPASVGAVGWGGCRWGGGGHVEWTTAGIGRCVS